MSFFGNNSLLLTSYASCDPDWTRVGSSYWNKFQCSISETVTTTSVADTLTTPSVTFPNLSSSLLGGVLLPDGRVFCVPHSNTTARIYDPIGDTLTTPAGTYPGNFAFLGGVLLHDGRVFCVPRNSTTARIYDPITNTLSTPTGTYPGTHAYAGGVVLLDGRVFCVPFSSRPDARIYGGGGGFDKDIVLSAYYNKV